MGNQSTQLDIIVTGQADLRSTNTSLNTYRKHIEAIIGLNKQLSSSSATVNVQVNGLSNSQAKLLLQYTRLNAQTLQAIKSNTDWTAVLKQLNVQHAQLANTLQRQLANQQSLIQKQQQQLSGLQQTVEGLKQHQQQINQTTQAGKQADDQFDRLLGTFLKYRALSAIWQGITTSIQAAVEAAKDYDYQTARSTRITGSGDAGMVRAALRGAVGDTGSSVKDAGEAYYQLSTFIKDGPARLQAFRTAMALMEGTESDARDTTRAMVQIYAQFGDQLDQTAGQAENYRRVGELLAGTFKGANAEMSEITSGLKYLGPVAEAAKIPLAQVMGVLTTLTAEGVRGRMSGTEAGQFISSMIKNYNRDEGGVVKGDKVYKFNLAQTSDGGMDLFETIRNVIRAANSLPTDKAREFLNAVGGTQNAFRFLGTQSEDTLKRMGDEIEADTRRLKGQTHEVDAMKAAMDNTFSVSASKAWQGFLGAISDSLTDVANKLHVIQGLHDLSKAFSIGPYSQNQDAQRGNQLLHQSPLMHALDMQAIAKAAQAWGRGGDMTVDNLGNGANLLPTEVNALLQLLPKSYDTAMLTGSKTRMIRGDDLKKLVAELDRQVAMFSANRGAGASGGVMSMQQAADVARKAGFSGDKLAIALAIAQAESSLNPSDVSKPNKDKWGSHDRGLWQINDHWHSEVSNADALDPLKNAQAAYRISEGGTNWSQWSTYGKDGNGIYKKYLPDAYKALGMKPGSGTGGPAIAKSKEALEREAEQRSRDAEQAQRDYIQQMRDDLDLLDAQLEVMSKKPSAAGIPAMKALQARRQSLALRIASKQGNEGEIYRINHGISSGTDFAGRYVTGVYDSKVAGLQGIFDAGGGDGANSAMGWLRQSGNSDAAWQLQQALIAGALSKGDMGEVARLKAQGPYSQLQKRIKSGQGDFQEQIRDNQWFMSPLGVPMLRAPFEKQAKHDLSPIESNLDAALFASQMATRPGYGTSEMQNADDRNKTLRDIEAYKDAIAKVKALPGQGTDAITEETLKLSKGLQELQHTLQQLNDQADLEALNKQLQLLQQQSEKQIGFIEDSVRSQSRGESRDSYTIRQMQASIQVSGVLANEVASLEADAKAHPESEAIKDALKDARSKYKDASRKPGDMANEYYNQRYQNSYDQLSSAANGSIMNFLHGNGDITQVFKAVGDSIVNQVLSAQVAKFTDPLVSATAKQITSLDHLSATMDSIATNGITINTGGSPTGSDGSIPNINDDGGGCFGVPKDPGTSTRGATPSGKQIPGLSKSQNKMAQKAMTAASYGMAAYSIWDSAAQNGLSVGGVLGGAMTGFEMGGPIGAAVGGVLSIFGGIFGHKKADPLANQKENNPSFYNSPSDFEYYAYRYRATGALPTAEQSGVTLGNVPNPVVNIYVDGVKTSVTQEVTRQTTTGAASMTNAYMDMHSPVG